MPTKNINAEKIQGVLSITSVSATTYYNLPSSSGSTTTFTGGTVTGPTVFIAGLTANTISATTYYNLPTDVYVTGGTYSSGSATFSNNTGGTFSVSGFSTGSTTNIGSGTINYLPKWTGSTALGNSLIRDDGTNIGINTAPSSEGKVSIYSSAGNTSALYVQNQSAANSYGVYSFLNSGIGSQTAILGDAQGHPTTGTSIGVFGFANDGLVGIGIKGQVGPTEFGSMTTGIGGYFNGRGDGGYGYPSISYSVQLLDGTEGINKVLISKTADGKANWSSTLSGLTDVYTNTLSATTYYNLPTDIRVTGGTYSNGTAQFTNNTGGTFNVTGIGSTGSNVGSGSTIFSGTSGSTLIFKTLTSTGSTININGSNTQTVNLETNAGVKVIPIATSSTAIGTGSNDYYLNFKLPYSLIISKVDFSVSTAGSDSVRIGIYRGQDLTAVLVGQSAGGTVSTLNSVSIVAESGQNLHFKAGEWMVIGVGVGGTTTNLFGMACPVNNSIAWTNTTDSSGGFPANPRSKAGTRTSFPSIEITVV